MESFSLFPTPNPECITSFPASWTAQFRFAEPEKEVFARMMKAFAAFHQVEVLTYCLMCDHREPDVHRRVVLAEPRGSV